MPALWGASVDGVSNKLPTRAGNLNVPQVVDNLETASGYVLAVVGGEMAVPGDLWELAARVVETGAAALTEMQDFPEQSTQKDALGPMLWAQFEAGIGRVQAGVEAFGGTPAVENRPVFNFDPPWLVPWRGF